MAQVQLGDTVKVHYTGTLDDGAVFDSTAQRGPLELTLGEGKFIPGFEQAIVGMTPGESKQVRVSPEEGFGPYYQELVKEIGRDQLPPEIDPEVGQQLQVVLANDQTMIVTVTDVMETDVVLDGNHPLAGKDLTFDIELVTVD